MIEKTLSAPSCTRYQIDLPFSSLRAGGKIRRVRLSHVRGKNGAFVCAEGTVTERVPNGSSLLSLICSPTLTGYGVQSAYYTVLYFLNANAISGIGNARRIIDYYNGAGELKTILVCPTFIYIRTPSGFVTILHVDCNCACVHFERVFAGSGTRLYYSAPMDSVNWDPTSTYGNGYIDFKDNLGNILEVVSLKGKVYVFREKGVIAINALADPLNFKVTVLPYLCGKIISGSVALGGDKIFFFTERGLFSFDGTAFKCAENAGTDEIDLSVSTKSTCFRNEYYALVTLKDGTHTMYSYDPENAMGRYLGFDAELIASNDGLYFSKNGGIWSVSGTALPKTGECAIEVDFTSDDGKAGEHFLESVTAAGSGKITVEVKSETSGSVVTEGYCGKPIRFPRALRGGEFTLKILPADEDFEIRSLSFGARRDSNDN